MSADAALPVIEIVVAVRCFFFFQAEDGIRDADVTGVQTCALPIYGKKWNERKRQSPANGALSNGQTRSKRSEEHTSELQSRPHLVCRLLLEKKKKAKIHGVRALNSGKLENARILEQSTALLIRVKI